MFNKLGGAGVGERTENDRPIAWFWPSDNDVSCPVKYIIGKKI
jgi:hypothetical protein